MSITLPRHLSGSTHTSWGRVLIAGIYEFLQYEQALAEYWEEGVVWQQAQGRQGVIPDTLQQWPAPKRRNSTKNSITQCKTWENDT